VILACVCAAGFSRQGSAVATLSIFVEPMTQAFGWSRTELSGALRDATGSYAASVHTFSALAVAGTLAALFSKHPKPGSDHI